MQNKRIFGLVLGAVFLLAGTVAAFAHGGDGGYYGGYGMHGYGMHGYGMQGYGMMGPGTGMGYGRFNDANLTPEQRDKLDEARDRFWSENRKLRREIADKQEELSDELGKDNVDAGKVAALQKELSKLEGDFDQKLVQHRLEVRKIAPDVFNGRGGYGRGYGRMHGGGYGDGYCWQD